MDSLNRPIIGRWSDITNISISKNKRLGKKRKNDATEAVESEQSRMKISEVAQKTTATTQGLDHLTVKGYQSEGAQVTEQKKKKRKKGKKNKLEGHQTEWETDGYLSNKENTVPKKKKKRQPGQERPSSPVKRQPVQERVPLSPVNTNTRRATGNKDSLACGKPAKSVDAVESISLPLQESSRTSGASRLSLGSTSEGRLSQSERLALEAEKLQLQAQIEADRAERSAEHSRLRSEAQEAHRHIAELEDRVADLQRQLLEAQDARAVAEQELAKDKSSTQVLQGEVHKLKGSRDELQKQVVQLRAEVCKHKAEKLSANRQLHEERRASFAIQQELEELQELKDELQEASMLQADQEEATEEEENEVEDVHHESISQCLSPSVITEAQPCPSITGATPCPNKELSFAEAASLHSKTGVSQGLTQQALDTLTQQNLGNQPPVRSASATSFRSSRDMVPARRRHSAHSLLNDNRRNSLVTVPTVTPSKDHAPLVYNEPNNTMKKSEYKAMLVEQIEENKERKRRSVEQERSQSAEWYPFGKQGAGAPIRDRNHTVVTNVTFARGTTKSGLKPVQAGMRDTTPLPKGRSTSANSKSWLI